MELELDGVDLRFLRCGGVGLVSRLYAAVRDARWGTVPARIAELDLDASDDGFHLSFTAEHVDPPIALHWRGDVVGGGDGSVSYAFDGVAGADFEYNRIGLCLNLPLDDLRGAAFAGRTATGTTSGRLPDAIAPQEMDDGVALPLFPAVSELELAGHSGARVRCTFEGDLFELEDQRNWTDASLKAYSAAGARGLPRRAGRGERLRQRVRIELLSPPRPRRRRRPALALGGGAGRSLPPLGLGLGSVPASREQLDALELVAPAHVRVDLPGRAAVGPTVAAAWSAATALGAPLQLALHLDDDAAALLADVRAALERERAMVSEAIVLRAAQEATGGEAAAVARTALGSALGEARVLVGTDAYFAQLNRVRPDPTGADGLIYSIQAQEHAFDDRSLVETLAVQSETARDARALAGGGLVAVGPVTLRARRAFSAPAGASRHVASTADPRQATAFGAAWTLGSVKRLAEAGADLLTYYELVGGAGVAGPAATVARPLLHVLADVAELRDGEIVACDSSAPLAVEALAVRRAGSLTVLLANLRAAALELSLDFLPAPPARMRRLHDGVAADAACFPRAFRARWEDHRERGPDRLTLAPYEYVRMEVLT